MTHDSLIVELKAGSSQAFARLVDNHLKKVINICYRFVNNREEAEDLAQETFVEVYESIARFRGDSAIATWIYRIAVRKSLDYQRKKNRRKRKGLITGLLRLSDPGVELVVPTLPGPDTELDVTTRREILYAALSSLPDNQRTAFLLSKYDELSHDDIAAVMNLSVSAVTSLIHRAKQNLQTRLSRFYRELF
jgi:RNA polymerase sigma-70 factor, ECF subfamily